MQAVELMLVVVLVLVSAMFSSLLVLIYKFGKLQKAVEGTKRFEK